MHSNPRIHCLFLLTTFLALAPLPAQSHATATRVFTLESSAHGNPEGVAFDPRTRAFFVGAIGDGTIYRGTLDDATVHVFIAGATGSSAVGMKVDRGQLFVAGGSTARITVFDLATRAQVGTFTTGTGGFVNDLVVTDDGDVYATDSFLPSIWHVPSSMVASGSGAAQSISVAGAIPYVNNAFNLNGIVATHGGRRLLVLNSATGALFRVDVDDHGHHGNHGGNDDVHIAQIDAPPLPGGDGMMIDRGRLVVVQGDGQIVSLQLRDGDRSADVDERRTDPALRGPSTIARARDTLLVVNADFATNLQPFTVVGLPR